MFNNLDTSGMEEAKDSLGGGGFIKNSAIYDATIKYAYGSESQTGAKAVNFEFVLEDGSTYRQTIYVTSGKDKGQKPYSEKGGKKTPLPGFSLADSICLITTGKSITAIQPEDKTINVYDFDLKAETPKSVPMLMELLGKPVKIGIVRKVEWKRKKVDDKWVDTDEEREFNEIHTAFHPTALVTVSEAKAGKKSAEEAEFYKAWKEKFDGIIEDRRKGTPSANSGNAGRPQPSNAPASGGGSTKGLFD